MHKERALHKYSRIELLEGLVFVPSHDTNVQRRVWSYYATSGTEQGTSANPIIHQGGELGISSYIF